MNRIKTELATIYKITEQDGTPVVLRDGDTLPRHSDCLRYDLGFCDPQEVSKVVFPVFRGKDGRTSPQITRVRWTSFGLLVERYDKDLVQPLGWRTFRHENEEPDASAGAGHFGAILGAAPRRKGRHVAMKNPRYNQGETRWRTHTKSGWTT